MNSASPRRGIVLFAHGSRDPLWHKPMEAVASHIRQSQTDALVLCAYLELSTPDLASAVATLTNQGVDSVTIVPMFLGVGKHAREDLPQLVSQLERRYANVQFSLQPAVGENPRLIALLADIALGGS